MDHGVGVLLLDCTYEPLKIISWTKAMTLLITGDAEMVEESDKRIRSATLEWKLPSVIRQLSKFRQRRKVHFSRINLYTRDAWTCQYCHVKKQYRELTFDHVLPRSQGGKTGWTNIVTACRPCNSKKDNRTPEQANMRLLRAPEEPKWLPAQMTIRLKHVPREWSLYVDPRSLIGWDTLISTT